MRKINNFDSIESSSGEFERMPAGGYVCTIINVEDRPDKEYLYIEFDVTEGDFTGDARNCYERAGFWPLTAYHSYKQSAEKVFKGFIEAVEKSNDGYKWDWNEDSLRGKDIGYILYTEHYVGNNGDVKERLKVKSARAAQTIRDGKFKVPADAWTDEAKTVRDAESLLGGDSFAAAEDDNPFK